MDDELSQKLPDGIKVLVDDMLANGVEGASTRVALVHFHKIVAEHAKLQSALLSEYNAKLLS